jgi:hypothetical protein
MRNGTSWSRLAILLLGLGAILAAGASLGGPSDDAGEGDAAANSDGGSLASTRKRAGTLAGSPAAAETQLVCRQERPR